MISKKELEEYAKLKNLKNIGYAEKDYFQNILLFIISQNYGKNFIFKGGTALNKCYGLNRFSEDLDFTCGEKPDLADLENGLKRFKLEFEIEKKEYFDEIKLIVRIKGPLYIGIKNSMCKIILDISLREKVILSAEIKTIGRFLDEIPSFDVLVMQKKEIFAEKIRAIITRNKARDIYDLWFLTKDDIKFDKSLVEDKLKYYKKKWDKKEFINKINNIKNIWNTELNPLVENLPVFKEVKREIIKNIKI
jgi:hypothetical protein